MFGTDERIKSINSSFKDELSRKIFTLRYMYSLTGDNHYIEQMVLTTKLGEQFLRICGGGHPIVVCGATKKAAMIKEFLPSINVAAFSDADETIETFCGLPKVNRKDIQKEYPDCMVLITALKGEKSIKDELIFNGINEKQIVTFSEYYLGLLHAQYFDLPELNLSWDESFVDCGAYDMETTDQIIEHCKKVNAFEPDPTNFKLCQEKFEQYIKDGRVEIFPYATYSRKEQLSFASGMSKSSALKKNGNVTIQAMPLDDVISERVSFIKMDIEGAELESLRGAERLLKMYHPKLAICVYHKPEDIIDIPEYILSINSDYSLYLRHYCFGPNETVLYAI